jgi:hypothetical protein
MSFHSSWMNASLCSAVGKSIVFHPLEAVRERRAAEAGLSLDVGDDKAFRTGLA